MDDPTIDTDTHFDTIIATAPNPTEPPPTIAPALSLDLRIRWLETLVYGTKQSGKGHERTSASLLRGVEELQRRLDAIVHSSEGLRRFMEHCAFFFDD